MKNSKNTISIPENLNRAFHNLYAYTSEEHGIRHSLLNESNLSFADARFMLIACSAFVNYLVSKADDANIKLEQKIIENLNDYRTTRMTTRKKATYTVLIACTRG